MSDFDNGNNATVIATLVDWIGQKHFHDLIVPLELVPSLRMESEPV